MKKLNFNEEKIQQLLLMLNELGFKHTLTDTSIDVMTDKKSRKVFSHEFSRINGAYQTPPLATQLDEVSGVISVFDTRLR